MDVNVRRRDGRDGYWIYLKRGGICQVQYIDECKCNVWSERPVRRVTPRSIYCAFMRVVRLAE
jgi:hypothetical protein